MMAIMRLLMRHEILVLGVSEGSIVLKVFRSVMRVPQLGQNLANSSSGNLVPHSLQCDIIPPDDEDVLIK